MTTPYTIECTVRFGRQGQGGALHSTHPTSVPHAGRIPRLARLMALALRLEKLLATGVVKDFRTLARLGHVSPARISQIVSLLHLAPDIQEALLLVCRLATFSSGGKDRGQAVASQHRHGQRRRSGRRSLLVR